MPKQTELREKTHQVLKQTLQMSQVWKSPKIARPGWKGFYLTLRILKIQLSVIRLCIRFVVIRLNKQCVYLQANL